MSGPTNLAVPVKLDAFVFNKSVCNGHPCDAKIAPITQPNYTFLQLDDSLIQNDILDHVDLHNAIPFDSNPRLVDLGQNAAIRQNRLGVYLHWVLPRFYRGGVAATPSAASSGAHAEQRRKKGFAVPDANDAAGTQPDYSSPQFRQLPNRWLVIRKLDPDAATTVPNRAQGADIPAVAAWVVESDRLRKIDDATLDDSDLQVDVSPFITTQSDKTEGNIHIGEQAEIFIGYREEAQRWSEATQGVDRADLTVVSASNHLFPDYQPHCSNVFSTLDTFACNINGKPGNLTAADVSYYVLGWHSDAANDPLADTDPKVTREVRLKNLNMALNSKPQDIQDWLQSADAARVLCHGAMYDVAWHVDKLPAQVPANVAAHSLANDMPVSVGTTPIDALLAYVNAHQVTDLEQDLAALGPLLRAQDHGVQAQRAATDELQNWNFARAAGGVHWHFQNDTTTTAQDPGTTQADALEKLNQLQRMADATARQLAELRWAMFSYWWQYACLSANERKSAQFPLDALAAEVDRLDDLMAKQQALVKTMSTDTKTFPQLPTAGVEPEFGQPRDPTLLVGGIQAGWPDDYLDALAVRLDTQLMTPTAPVGDMTPYCTRVLPEGLRDTALALAEEFLILAPPPPTTVSQAGEAGEAGKHGQDGRSDEFLTYGEGKLDDGDGHYPPLYHDYGKHGDPKGTMRDQWGGTQPWFPLFIEWEAEYFHVPWNDWQLEGKLTDQLDQRWKLGIRDGVVLSTSPALSDTRSLSGRILLLPQPNFSLQAAVADLFGNTDPDLIKKYLPTQAQRDAVRNDTYQLPFLSAPLDGFTAELLTLVKGTHIKPNARYPQTGYALSGLQPLPDAQIGPFGPSELAIIGASSEMTPFGTTVRFSAAANPAADGGDDATPISFKPVTHGQFRFAKLNIVDKFGQAICAIDPRYGHEDEQAVYPCLGDYFAPQQLQGSGQPNVVIPPPKDKPGFCEFAQVPPAINQPARLNCTFVKHDKRHDCQPLQYAYWRPVTEWESPIWGWIVLNYVDYGLQIFLPDGTFYREVRLAAPGSKAATSLGAKWLPFDPPTVLPDTRQLDLLLNKLTAPDQTYLLAFLAMAGQSLDASASAPSAYGSFLGSLVGRPLALVNAGWSLELATDAKTDQSSLDNHQNKQTGLLQGKEIYQFPLKLGDKDRACDGLVGYFKALADPQPGNELELSAIYTYYVDLPDEPKAPLKQIGTDNYPPIPSFWLQPDNYIDATGKKTPLQSAGEYTRDWNAQLEVFGMLVDPFVPVTSYSSVLPIGSLRLPPWTWQAAMNKMTAFFHLGPVLVTDDVQRWWDQDPTKTLGPAYALSPPDLDQTVKGSAVGIPSLPVANWAWLQPFVDPASGKQEHMALGLAKVDSKPGYQAGPYTALEGYLQLKAPIICPDTPAKPKPQPPSAPAERGVALRAAHSGG